jgi:hypothetical protein
LKFIEYKLMLLQGFNGLWRKMMSKKAKKYS